MAWSRQGADDAYTPSGGSVSLHGKPRAGTDDFIVGSAKELWKKCKNEYTDTKIWETQIKTRTLDMFCATCNKDAGKLNGITKLELKTEADQMAGLLFAFAIRAEAMYKGCQLARVAPKDFISKFSVQESWFGTLAPQLVTNMFTTMAAVLIKDLTPEGVTALFALVSANQNGTQLSLGHPCLPEGINKSELQHQLVSMFVDKILRTIKSKDPLAQLKF
jgi:hypothetical protein